MIERKRGATISKNQATSHPICQAVTTCHIKNKLSTNSEERKGTTERIPAISAMTSKHKRHKSDTVENHNHFYQPLIGPSVNQLIN